MKPNGHPAEAQLALYAGGDAGWVERWRLSRHVNGCAVCRREVEAFRCVPAGLRAAELPDLRWNHLAAEMKANIRLGLEAGRIIAEPPANARGSVSGIRQPLAALASLLVLLAGGYWLQRPSPVSGEPVALTTEAGIQVSQAGQTLTLLHGRATEVTYSAAADGAVRARYVDSETGNVTITHVYVQ